MRRRPVCILCMLLVVFLCVTDWLGFSLIRGNPLPQSVQTWIRKHPESTICGEVVRCRENEDFQSVYLRNTYLIYNSEKVSIDNIKVKLNYICLFDYLFISSQMSAKPYFIGSTGILLLW